MFLENSTELIVQMISRGSVGDYTVTLEKSNDIENLSDHIPDNRSTVSEIILAENARSFSGRIEFAKDSDWIKIKSDKEFNITESFESPSKNSAIIHSDKTSKTPNSKTYSFNEIKKTEIISAQIIDDIHKIAAAHGLVIIDYHARNDELIFLTIAIGSTFCFFLISSVKKYFFSRVLLFIFFCLHNH